jgi:hypothetical protein
MSVQVLFKITIKDPGSKDVVASELNNLNLLPYSIKKVGKNDPDPTHSHLYINISRY